ncbi:hypothetical protein ACXWTF_13180 [Thiomicrolovo sp. ZZH C-3]
MSKRVYFPRFLSRQRLFFTLEVDEWIVLLGTAGGSFYLLNIFLSVPLLVALGVAWIVAHFTYKAYTKYSKEASPGLLKHIFYDFGLLKPKTKDNDVELPFGFERIFRD